MTRANPVVVNGAADSSAYTIQSVATQAICQKASSYRLDIEGLRGLAVLLVVAFHCGLPGFRSGFIGVDVFFVISGYLITGLLVAEFRKTSRIDLVEFYARRVRRLLPASAFTLVITLAAASLVLAPYELFVAGQAARAAALYISNMFFAMNSADYFAHSVETNPLLHTWSLAVEEQFYLFWPLLILLGLQFWRSIRGLAALLAALTIASFAVNLWFFYRGGTLGFFGLPSRAWEFGLGGLAVLLPPGMLRWPAQRWIPVSWVGIGLVLGAGALISPGSGFPGWAALFPALGSVAVLIAGRERPNHGVSVLLGSGPLKFLGVRSYSWYLWHWPLLVLFSAVFPDIGIAGKCAVVALSLALAVLTHAWLENPIRRNPYLQKHAVVSLALAVFVTAGSVAIASLAIRRAERLSQSPALKKISAVTTDIADLSRQSCVTLDDSAAVKPCTFGVASSAVQVVLFGDSHAIQWFNPLRRIAEAHGWKLTTIVKAGCPAADYSPSVASRPAKANCAAWRTDAIRSIIELHPTLVVVGSATIYLGHQGQVLRPTPSTLDAWGQGTRRTLTSLSNAGFNVVAMRDTPLPPFDVPTCLARIALHSWYPQGSCAIPRSSAVDAGPFEREKQAAASLPYVRLLDMTDAICDGTACPAMRNGEIVYRDDSHLTGKFATSLTPALESRLLPLVSGLR